MSSAPSGRHACGSAFETSATCGKVAETVPAITCERRSSDPFARASLAPTRTSSPSIVTRRVVTRARPVTVAGPMSRIRIPEPVRVASTRGCPSVPPSSADMEALPEVVPIASSDGPTTAASCRRASSRSRVSSVARPSSDDARRLSSRRPWAAPLMSMAPATRCAPDRVQRPSSIDRSIVPSSETAPGGGGAVGRSRLVRSRPLSAVGRTSDQAISRLPFDAAATFHGTLTPPRSALTSSPCHFTLAEESPVPTPTRALAVN